LACVEGRLLLKNCSIFRADGRIRSGMAVLIEGGRITRVAEDAQLPVLPGDWEVACRGRLVMPGLVDCHTHLVGGALLPVTGEFLLRPPRARLEETFRIDSLLTAADVEVLTTYGLARAARGGVTLSVEHLHCPGDVLGGLAAQARAAERIGVRLVTSHSTSSQAGSDPLAQLEANAEFAKSHRSHPLVRGALGFHTSSTCDDELLRRVGRLREELALGAHYHLAESEEDLTSSFAQTGRRIVPRLEAFGLLGAGVVASHARAINRAEADRLARTRTLVALSPRLDLLYEPGGGGLEAVLTHDNLMGLASIGAGSLWDELTAAFVSALHIARAGRLLDPDGMIAQMLVSGPAELCTMIYGQPSGTVEADAMADLVVYDLVPAKEDLRGQAPHLLLLFAQAPVAWTIVGGRVVVREGQLLSHDFLEIAQDAARVVEAIWSRAGRTAAVTA
jgi:5-methylthioadenosine/S-adenosylhomocysteine deaminase